MKLNDDVLALVLSYVDLPELLQLSLSSQALRCAAIPFMYADVCVDTLPKLEAFATTIKQTPAVARRVKTFTEAVSTYRPFYAGVAPSQWPHYLTLLMSVLNGLPALARVALSISFDGCGDAHAPMYLRRVSDCLGTLEHLEMLAVSDLDYDALDLLEVCPPLKVLHLSASHTEWTGVHPGQHHTRIAWVKKLLPILDRRHARTLVELDIPYASVVGKPEFAHIRMPNLRTLMCAQGVCVRPALTKVFPALRHLRLSNDPQHLEAMDRVWPALEHLELEAWQPGILSPNHHVRSLSLCLDSWESFKEVASLSSVHVEALRLRYQDNPRKVESVLACFPNVKYLDVPFSIDTIERFKEKLHDESSQFTHRIQIVELNVVIIPPPPVAWQPDIPLDALRAKSPDFRAAAVHWIDSDFTPNTQAWMYDPQTAAAAAAAAATNGHAKEESGGFAKGGFVGVSAKDFLKLAEEYRFTTLWPKRESDPSVTSNIWHI